MHYVFRGQIPENNNCNIIYCGLSLFTTPYDALDIKLL